MVLVSYILDNYISVLQTKFSDREGHEARRIGLEAMPLDQCIEGGHGARQARLKIRPAPMHPLFEMTDERQHREYRLHRDAVRPYGPLTQLEIARIAVGGMEAGITQDAPALAKLPKQPLKHVVREIGGVTRPRHRQAVLVQQQSGCAADSSAMIGE